MSLDTESIRKRLRLEAHRGGGYDAKETVLLLCDILDELRKQNRPSPDVVERVARTWASKDEI